MEKELLSNLIAAKIHRVDNGIQREFNRIFSEYGLTTQQAMVLGFLGMKKIEGIAINQRKLQEFLQISNPSVVSLVNTLERKGLITRGDDPNDGRSTILLLSEKGDLLQEKISQLFSDTDDAIAKTLTAKEVMQLQKIMDKLVNTINPTKVGTLL